LADTVNDIDYFLKQRNEKVFVSMIELNGYDDITPVHGESKVSLFSAVHNQSGQPVMLMCAVTPPPPSLNHFKSNYECISRIPPDHIARTYDFVKIQTAGQNADVLIYEQVPGILLKDYLNKKKISVKDVLKIGIQLSAVLADLHTIGINNAGFSPSGVTVNPTDQTIKISSFDFLTSNLNAAKDYQYPEIPAYVLPYISPEQTGRTGSAIDYRTDFYSLGTILYECLTGMPPFTADDPQKLIYAHLAVDPEDPYDIDNCIPDTVSQIIMKMMAKEPEDRYQSAWGIKADLEQCLSQWRQKGSITPFVLAGSDVTHLLRISNKLYGRKDEICELLKVFSRVSCGGTEMMLISGPAGIGKSALVNKIQNPIESANGYYISGKFDQMKRNIPYASLIQAFDSLIEQILAESREQIAIWKDSLLKALGSNGQVIIEVIPDLELIIGKQPEVPKINPDEAQNRFTYVFVNFINTFADKHHPLTLFLDDLQWADTPSLKLMETFINRETKYQF